MPSARDRARTLRHRARGWLVPPPTVAPTPLVDATGPDPAAVVALATRDLLRAESCEDVARIVANVVDVLGGRVVPARHDDPDALPLDVSFGVSEPMLPTAPVGSRAHGDLVVHLPGLVADARVANDGIIRTAHLASDVATDPVTGLATRATFTRELQRLRPDDAVVVVRVTVPPPPPGEEDGLEQTVREFAGYLLAQRAHGDHAARVEEDEFGLLLRQTGRAGTAVVVSRLQRSWEAARPDTRLHVGVAPFRESGTATLRDAYDALDRALDADDPVDPPVGDAPTAPDDAAERTAP